MKSDSLYAAEQYFEASIEYERLIFKTADQADLNYLKYKKALCYKKLKEYDRALNTLQSIYFSNSKDSLYRFVSYEQSLCHYLNGDPARALWKIDEFFHRSRDTASFHFFMPIRILSLNDTKKWDEAKQSFLQYIEIQEFETEKEEALENVVNNLYEEKNRPRMKSIKKAENWSRFIPGTGQIYAGRAGEGTVNFLINASVLTFAGFQVYNGFYITGYLAGLGFFNKTYHGGIKRAGVLASYKNQKLMNDFNRKINAEILSEFETD